MMPVDDHAVLEKNKIGDDFRYGCHNRDEYMDAYYAPNRAAGTDGYKPIWFLERVRIPHRMTRNCMTAQTGWAKTDPNCRDCKRIT